MWENIKIIIAGWINELIALLDINQEKIAEISIDSAKAVLIIII